MAREDHQPGKGAPTRPHRGRDVMREMCGRTIAFVLALGCEPGDIAHAVSVAHDAQVAATYVVAKPAFVQRVQEAVQTVEGEIKPLAQVIVHDPLEAIERTRDAGNFELFSQLSYALLEDMRSAAEAAEATSRTYGNIVVLNAAQERVLADHVYELVADAREHPGVEIVVSWIQMLRRMPCVLTRGFLGKLESYRDALLATCAEGYRHVLHLPVRDHVFGEEELAAAHVLPSAVESFLGSCTMSALQAVQRASCLKRHPSGKASSLVQNSFRGKSDPNGPINDADALLMQAAADALSASEGLAPNEVAELEWADAFGQRSKKDFPLLNDADHMDTLVYLDSAATAQRVDVALEAEHDWDAHANANVYRGAYELSSNATSAFDDARTRLENHIGADERQTVYTANATGGINLVAQAWGERNIAAGDLIVCELAAHHANFLPFLMLAERKGARVECVPYAADGRIDQGAFAALMAQSPKLVCVAQVGNVLGVEAPVKELAAAAHAAGARVLVDAAQSFAHVLLDVGKLGADWVAFSAHKAYGPMGIGALWISPGVFGEMDPLGGGGGVVTHVSTESYRLRPKSLQYEMGTPPVSQAIGWAAAIDYLDSVGMENVARHSAVLTRYAVRGLQRIDGVNVIGDHSHPDGQMGLVSFTVRSVAPADVAKFLGRLNVAIRSGGHCALPLHAALGLIGTGRISIGVYTTRADIDAALAAIALCRQLYENA